jgi:hypothetical protein
MNLQSGKRVLNSFKKVVFYGQETADPRLMWIRLIMVMPWSRCADACRTNQSNRGSYL